ncbi:spherulation-specific family 4 protein [Streptomyces sp. NPDC049040]|uniref:spherulation-specific family 4 protein n=1 Tax=Streptomyces sp. NPDC049040 TaxID=3365593 RepID=UPI0037205FAF
MPWRATPPAAAARSLLVPLYIHPAVDPGAWLALERAARRLYGVVVNVADGPGSGGRPDGVVVAAAEGLRAAGVPLFGYVDTGYGTRPVQEVDRDVRRHREWFGVRGVFLDRVAAGRDRLPYYRRLAGAARLGGARTVVLNPGVHPDPGYAAVCDLLVTYEGSWTDYAAADVPGWTADHPPERFCHLVYGVPGDAAARAVARTAAGRGAAVHCAVPGGPPNPWQHVPAGPA